VLASVCAFEVRYDLPVVFVPTAQAGARLVERWAFYYARQAVETVNNLLAAGHLMRWGKVNSMASAARF
jgi:hypothetical protein